MKMGWRGALGFLLSAGLLWWTLHDVDVGEVASRLASSNIPLLLASSVTATLIFPLRARRWRTLLDPVAPGIPFGPLWRATAIGMMVNNVVPARAGELARAFALTREEPRVRFPASLASLAVDRLLDAIVILSLMAGGMLASPLAAQAQIGGRPVASYAVLFAIGMGVLLALVYAIVFLPRLVVGIADAIARRVLPRRAVQVHLGVQAFVEGLGVLRSPRLLVEALLWTIVHWLVNAFAFWIAFVAVGIDAPFGAALFLQGLIAIGVAIPSAPGFFGVFEAFATIGLGLYGVGQTEAVTWAIGFHLLSFVPITVMGAWYFARLGLRLGEMAPPRAEPV